MTAAGDREAEEPAPRCPRCSAAGEFGYRDIYGAMRWFCGAPARAVLGGRADAGNCHQQRRSAD